MRRGPTGLDTPAPSSRRAAPGPAAFSTTRAPTSCSRPDSESRTRAPVMRDPSRRREVTSQWFATCGSARDRFTQEGQGQTLAALHLCVVPERAARRGRPRAGRELAPASRSGPAGVRRREPLRGGKAAVAVEAQQVVQDQAQAEGFATLGPVAIGRHQEGQRPNEGGGHPQQGPSLAHGLAVVGQVEALQVPQAAVDRLEAVPGRARAEVHGFDEGHLQAAARGLVGGGDAVDAAAHHEQVVGHCGQRGHVPPHPCVGPPAISGDRDRRRA